MLYPLSIGSSPILYCLSIALFFHRPSFDVLFLGRRNNVSSCSVIYIVMSKLELLAPAKNLEFGREAVNHGADALYIGAPAFGARQAATNTISDIEALVRYAHIFGSKVFATVNTILFDDELEAAVSMIRQLYNAGVDALIIQDLGLLECDLPPIELHASTPCHNASLERIKFM